MYMGQPPVYAAAPGSMAPADMQAYQSAGGAPGPCMTQTPNYSNASGQSIAPSSEKALL